jgi:hypothetical protein
MILLRSQQLVFVIACAILMVHEATCIAAPRGQQVVFVEEVAVEAEQEEAGSDEEDEDEDEFEEEGEFNNNPWQVDERKLFAAKKFQLENQFAVKVVQMDNVCGLDKKQKLKLKIACKGATEKALVKFEKQWREQMKQFGGFNMQNDDEEDEEKKKKKRKRKKKRFVVKKVADIDAQVFQMLDQNFLGGVVKPDVTEVAMWKRTVKKVLSEEQQEKLKAHDKKLKLAKRNARADSFIANMRSKLALSDKQLDEFDTLVRPNFLKSDIEVNWNYDAMATLYLGSKYDKKKMKSLLSNEQNLVLEITVKPAEGYAGFFGDNANVVVGQAVAVQQNVVFEIFDDLFRAVGDIADAVEGTMNGVLEWAQ